jgi:signal transduction histidine kinase
MKSYNNADSYFHQSLLIQKELNDEFGMTTNLLNLGRLNLALKRINESLLWAQNAVDLSRKNHEQEQLREGLKLLALIQSDLKNYPEAFRAQLEYSTILEKRNIQEQNDQLANTLVLYELGQKKQENEILLARNENYRLSIEKQSLNKWRISLGVTILLVVIAIGVIVYRYNLKRKENKRLEEDVRQAVFQQQQQQKIIFHQSSLTSLGELAAGIAHEINQPIQNISLSSEIIRDELSANDYNKKFVQKTVNGIFDDIDRIRGIIDHIRIFSSGQKEGIIEYFNPDTVIADSLKMIRQQMINRGIILKEEYNAGSVLLLGNPHKFEQVIINLLSNSRDALAEKADKAKNIEIYTSIKENLLIVEIFDNGLGINPDKLTDIFLPFYTTKKLGQGTGLGLSIAHGIIAQMNGRIIPDSQLNEGTTMRIELPIVNQNIN